MAYEDVSKFFNDHFAAQTYTIEENKYFLYIEQFQFSNQGTKAVVHMPFELAIETLVFKKKNERNRCI